MSDYNLVQNVPAVVKQARERFKMCVEAETERRRAALEDLNFLAGEQWPDAIKKQRESEGRPCLTINRLPQFLRQVTNEERQNRPAIKVSPVDDGGDEETAEVLQGLVRHIEYNSNADTAYDTAFEFAAATGGPGWIWVYPEYDDDSKTRQILRVCRVRNPFVVYDDPAAVEADRSDSKFRFKIETLTKAEYKELYPKSKLASLDDWKSVGDNVPGWMTDDSVTIAEYYYFDDGDDDSESESEEYSDADEQEAPQKKFVLKWCKLNAVEVLDETIVKCKWIPSVPVFGDELEIDGKLVLKGIVRDAKDPQRMFNYWKSAETEAIALAPKAPWVGAAGQFENFEQKWGTSNVKSWAYLEYNNIDNNGSPVGPPTRQVVEPAVQAITGAALQAADDLKATTGIYDAQLGAKSNEQTGKAILARQQQSQVSNFHYIDNLSRAIRHLGRILINWIPAIYDSARVVRIIGEDGKHDLVHVNRPFEEDGVQKVYDLTTGTYDVTVSSGPSYQTRRQESVAAMMAFVNANPAMVNIVGDLLVGAMDWPNHEKIAERLRKMLPPQLQDDDGSPESKLMQAQAQLQQMGQQTQLLSQALQRAQEIIKTKQVEHQAKVQIAQFEAMSKENIVKMQEATKLSVAQINASKDANQGFAERELQQYQILHDSAHDFAMQRDQQAHEHQMADKQAAIASMQSAQDAAQQSAQDFQQQQASPDNG